MEASKQSYIVWSTLDSMEDHKTLYINLTIPNDNNIDTDIRKEYKYVKYLGLLLNININWKYQINQSYKNGHLSYINMYNKYKNVSNLRAATLPQLYETYVISKMFYGIEFWGSSKQDGNEEIE